MTWDSLSALVFQCIERGEVPRPVLILAAIGTLASIIQALFTLYRWLKQRRKIERYRVASSCYVAKARSAPRSTAPASDGQFRYVDPAQPQRRGEPLPARRLLHESFWLVQHDSSSRNRAAK